MLAAKCGLSELDLDLSVTDLRIGQNINDSLSFGSGNFDECGSIEKIDDTNLLGWKAGFIGDCTNQVSRSETVLSAHADENSNHAGFWLFAVGE